MQTIFKTSIRDLIDRNKFFQCFVCLEEFDKKKKYPMQICEKQHFMCLECVQSNMFKKNLMNNGFICNLCSCTVEKKLIRRSPFLLSIKQFVEGLTQRQRIRKNKYKECFQKQTCLAEQLLNQNIQKSQRIEILQSQLRDHQEITNSLLEQLGLKQNKQVLKSKIGIKTQSGSIFQSGIKLEQYKQEENKKLGHKSYPSKKNESIKQKIPTMFKSMFDQVNLLKQQIDQSEDKQNQEYKQKLKQLQKHEKYLYQIIEQSHQFTQSTLQFEGMNGHHELNKNKNNSYSAYQGYQLFGGKKNNHNESESYPDL